MFDYDCMTQEERINHIMIMWWCAMYSHKFKLRTYWEDTLTEVAGVSRSSLAHYTIEGGL